MEHQDTSNTEHDTTVPSSSEMVNLETDAASTPLSPSQSIVYVLSPSSPCSIDGVDSSGHSSMEAPNQTHGSSSSISSISFEPSPTDKQYFLFIPTQAASTSLCFICGDHSAEIHYDVYSCKSCTEFFERTVRRKLKYDCLKEKQCEMEKGSRRNCQYCRYQKCIEKGMDPESVQKVRRSTSELPLTEPMKTLLEKMIEAETRVQNLDGIMVGTETLEATANNLAVYMELFQLIEWAKHLPDFYPLSLYDKIILLRSGWNELLILGLAYRSIKVKGTLKLADGHTVNSFSADQVGLAEIFDHVLSEIVANLKQLELDEAEFACLKSIVIFNPESPHLQRIGIRPVERIRAKVDKILKRLIHRKYPNDPNRYNSVLSTLSNLKSVSQQCQEHLFFNQVVTDTPIYEYLRKKLATSALPGA